MLTYLLNLEYYLVNLLLEHQYLTTTAIYLYLACWLLYLAFLGDQFS